MPHLLKEVMVLILDALRPNKILAHGFLEDISLDGPMHSTFY
jgi:hypothetical protein